MLTAKMSVRRNTVYKVYEALIEQLHSGDAGVYIHTSSIGK
jgi:hypothetical protein